MMRSPKHLQRQVIIANVKDSFLQEHANALFVCLFVSHSPIYTLLVAVSLDNKWREWYMYCRSWTVQSLEACFCPIYCIWSCLKSELSNCFPKRELILQIHCVCNNQRLFKAVQIYATRRIKAQTKCTVAKSLCFARHVDCFHVISVWNIIVVHVCLCVFLFFVSCL